MRASMFTLFYILKTSLKPEAEIHYWSQRIIKIMSDFSAEINNFVDTVNKAFGLAQLEFGIPQNIIRNDDGSWTIEIAVVGLTKDDLKLTSEVVDGKLRLVVENKNVNKTKDVPETNYKDHRIKFFKKASWTISSDLDLDGMKAKVENGLMTITIPVAAKAKPNEYSIE